MLTICGTKRTKYGTKASRKLRLKNKFPAIVYCSSQSNFSIELNQDVFSNLEAKNTDFYTNKIILMIDHVKYTVKIQEIQRHAFKPKILHIDFVII